MKKIIHALVGITATLLLTASAFSLSTDSFTFPNNTGKDVDDLHVEWTKGINIDSNTAFKKTSGSGTSSADFSKGTVKDGDSCEVKVSYDGTDPEVKKWWWTIDGKKVRDEKVGDVVALATGDQNGMTTMLMSTGAGKVIAYFPDTIWKGATIRGTVVAMPNNTPGSADTLRGMVMQVGDKKIPGATGTFIATIAGVGGVVSLLDKGGRPVCSTTIPVGNAPAPVISDPGSEPFKPPPLTQSGKPIELPGTFDPSKPIDCAVNGKPATVMTANAIGAVVMPSEKVVGAYEASIANGDNSGKVKGCAVDVTLSAAKTTVMSGESISINVGVGPFIGVPADQFPVELTLRNSTPGNLRLDGMGGNDMVVIHITEASLQGGTMFNTVLTGTGLAPGGFEIVAEIASDKCGHEVHEYGIDKLSKGKDAKGWFVDWREDCHQGNCHKRKNHAGDHAYSWKNCKTHASKEHKDYYSTEADRDAAYEKLEKESGVRKAKHGF